MTKSLSVSSWLSNIMFWGRVAPVAAACALGSAGTAEAAAFVEGARTWPQGVVAYRIEPLLLKRAGATGSDCEGWRTWRSSAQASVVCRGMAEWARQTGVRFVAAKTTQRDALVIRDGAANTARLGYFPSGNYMTVALDTNYRSVLHELGHALGLIHEHQRNDRGDYIRLSPVIAHIMSKCLGSDLCRRISREYYTLPKATISSEYDPCSIMHYEPGLLAKYDARLTQSFSLTAKGQARWQACRVQFSSLPATCHTTIGKTCALSRMDIDVVRRLYGKR